MRGIGRSIRAFGLVVLICIAWLAGDRFGVPQPARDLINTAFGSASVRSREAWMETEVAIRERLAEAREADLDIHLPELPDFMRPEDLLVQAKEKQAFSGIGPAAAQAPLAEVRVCRGKDIANAPAHGADLAVRGLPARIDVNGVSLRTVPVASGCISSGFGPRRGKVHRGVDFHHPSGSEVIAAGAGEIVEAGWRDDFGNYIIIDHGAGVFTRYAHLASFAAEIREGASVRDGAVLGPMGNTASYPVPVHLHFELLRGDYDTPKKSFGLVGADPLNGHA